MKTALSPEATARIERVERYLPDSDAFRARFGVKPDHETLTELGAWYQPPRWAAGAVGVIDACFLFDVVACVRPERVLELGVASGGSTSVLLRAMDAAGLELACGDARPAIRSFDLHPMCYSDRTKPVGSAVFEMAPQLARGVEVRSGLTSVELGPALAGENFPLAFIDANHQHPWPTLDLLALLPSLAPGAWVVLHDIDLPAAAARYERTHNTKVHWHDHGAKHLFDAWPFEKIRGEGEADNIGILRMPEPTPNLNALRLALSASINKPWETDPGERGRAILTGDRIENGENERHGGPRR